MNVKEILELFELFRALPYEKQKEFYFMIKGAAFGAGKTGKDGDK